MKNYNQLFLPALCGMAALLPACEDGDTSFDEYPGYEQVYYLETSGITDVDFYNAQADSTYYLPVGKGGTDNQASGKVHARIMTETELADYNSLNQTKYEMLPEKFYSLVADYELTPEHPKDSIRVTLKKEIGSGELDFASHQYVVPLKISSTTGSVNEDLNSLLLLPELITPTISMSKSGVEKTIEFFAGASADMTKEVQVVAGLNVTNPGWEFDVKFVTDRNQLQTLVDRFNASEAAQGKHYLLLPEEGYEIPEKLAYASIHSRRYFNIELKRGTLEANVDYLLPVATAACEGMPFKVNQDNVYYLPVKVGNKLSLTSDQITVISEQDGPKANLIDGDPSTLWQSVWSGDNEPAFDPTYGLYVDMNLGMSLPANLQMKLSIADKNNRPKETEIFGWNGTEWISLFTTENLFPNPNDSGATTVEENISQTSANVSKLRIAFYNSNVVGTDFRKGLEWMPGYWYNVKLSEIEIYGR